MPKKDATDKVPSKRSKAFQRWMARHGLNTSQVSKATGVKYQTLASFVQGDTKGMRGDAESTIASHYETIPAVIFEGAEELERPQLPELPPLPPGVRSVNVYSWVAAGRLTSLDNVDERPTETIEISGLPAGNYFGTRARGDSMDRIAPDGSLLIVDAADRELVPGRRYIFSHRGSTTFKRYGANPDRLEPESLNLENQTIFPRERRDWEVIGRVRLVVTNI